MSQMGGEAERPALYRQKSWPLHRGSTDLTDGLCKLSRGKSLRFADTEGLPLVSFFRSDSGDSLASLASLSESPPDSFHRVVGAAGGSRQRSSSTSTVSPLTAKDCRHLRFEQPQPVASADFQRLLQRNLVCLENVVAHGMTVFGTVRVRNVSFEKSVVIRYSWDDWATHSDLTASYVAGSCDGPTDRFSFTLVIMSDLPVGGRVQFAVNFRASGGDFWDNNSGKNYSLVCEQSSSRTSTSTTSNHRLQTSVREQI